MDRNCSNCTHKPICRLWYSEVIKLTGPTAVTKLNKELALDCRFWKEDGEEGWLSLLNKRF